MTILIIEDEAKLVDILKKALKGENYATDAALDGEEGLQKALKNNYGLIILDIMLPKRDGLSVAKELRARNIHTPILMLTARGTMEDKVAGLDIGADDYLIKPFGIDELFARVRAILRRRKTTDSDIWKVADLILDKKKHEVTRAGKVIALTPKEYRLLDTMVTHRDQAMSRRQLIENAWGPDFVEANNELNVHIRYLRRKIDSEGLKPLIHTVRGVGYIVKEA
ncbi:MAG: two component transcriptional regulator, winged helix family [Candidatus Taylorbacteria bacterium]|nr:two component transcriptional regulator, winged helix family [Candidatus Taylorbacteria bacterium]